MNYSDEIIRCYVILFSDLEKSVADAMICIWLYVYIRFLWYEQRRNVITAVNSPGW
jgi:hypothetical protein